MTPLRTIALLAVAALAILAMIWPLKWPKTMQARAVVAYFVSLVFGILVLLLFPYGHGESVPFFGTMMLLAWVLLGVLWVIRRRPDIPNPEWLRRPWSMADWGLIVIIVLSALATALG